MSQLAVERIEENIRTKNKLLDLRLCGLVNTIPQKILECAGWLETLALGNGIFWDEELKKVNWVPKTGTPNQFNDPDLSLLQQLPLLTSLHLSSCGMVEIKGLERLSGLTTLNLSYNQLTEIKGLDGFSGLTTLNLSYNRLTEIKGLEGLSGLATLNLSGNQLTEIKGLDGLSGLTTLYLFGNQLTEIKGLESLSGLTELDLYGNQLTEIKGLDGISCLTKLNLWGNQLTEIKGLEGLSGLATLDLSGNQLTEIKGLEGLSGLTELDLSGNQLTEIKGLESLSELTTLYLFDNQLREIKGLEGLSGLTELDLSGNQLTEIKGLEGLLGLSKLDLSDNKLTEIRKLESLSGLTELDLSGNQLTEIKGLEGLSGLAKLDLSGNQLTEIKGLEGLSGLAKLNLSVNQLTEIKGLESLLNLKKLDLRSNKITLLEHSCLKKLPGLEELKLENNPMQNIRAEIVNLDNSLQALKDFFAALERGKVPELEAKVILIGNGRVGKTSFVNRWIFNRFNEKEDSTHGIQLVPHNMTGLAEDTGLKSLRLNIWDFGGQDIYHATHRMFMNTSAIFILVWDAEAENNPTQTQKLETGPILHFKNHDRQYWLSHIKTLGKNSPVLVIRTKKNKQVNPFPTLTDSQVREYNVAGELEVESESAMPNNGFRTFRARMEELVADLAGRGNNELPQQWFNIKKKIWEKIETCFADKQGNGRQDNRLMTLNDFYELCADEQINEREAGTLLEYFHNCGLVFYRKGLFGNQIVLDQVWAIDAIYTILDRKGIYSLKKNNGLITGEDLSEVWNKKGYSPAEQQLFVDFMKGCEICFELKENYSRPFAEREFIAPQLLPEQKPSDEVFTEFENNRNIYYKYRHKHLHAAIIQRFIVRNAGLSQPSYMWQNGMVLTWEKQSAIIEALPKNNEILVRVQDEKQQKLLDRIRNEIKEITKDEEGIKEFVSLDGKAFIAIDKLRMHPAGSNMIEAENSEYVEVANYRKFLYPDEKELFRPGKEEAREDTGDEGPGRKIKSRHHNHGRKLRVFFSYSHKDEQYKDELDKHLSPLKRNNRIETWHDRKILPGEVWDKRIKEELEKADIVLLMLSSDFISSDYIWEEELKIIRERHQKNDGVVVIPIFVRPLYTEGLDFMELQSAQKDKQGKIDWISSAPDRDAVYRDIVKEIDEAMKRFR